MNKHKLRSPFAPGFLQVCLVLLLSIWTLAPLKSQSPQGPFFVGTQGMASLPGNMVEVKLSQAGWVYEAFVDYGQECIARMGALGFGWEKMRNCAGLKDKNRKMVTFSSYIAMVNLMEAAGWYLVSVGLPADAGNNMNKGAFLFRRASAPNQSQIQVFKQE
ncbi:MAG: hypothetical protein AAFR61_05740 [Bacteroidota bacterium]